MDDSTRKALRILDDLVCEPRPGPYGIDAEYAASIARVEALACNQDGADKSWVFRARAEYDELRRTIRRR